MINRFRIAFLSLLIVASASASLADDGCADAFGCIEIAPDAPIVFGGLLRLSGPEPWTGNVAVNAFQLASLARGDMLLGREIELVLEDSACSEEGAREGARRLIENPAIVGIIGTTCSLAAKGALPVISEAGWLMISPSNSSPFLTVAERDAGGLYQPGYFRTSHNDRFQGALSAQFATAALGIATIATIDDGDPYTRGLSSAMASTFSSLGGKVVFQGVIKKGATDISGILRAISDSGAELVYFPVFTSEALIIVEQLANMPGLEDVIMMTADGAFAKSFAQDTGDAGIGLYIAGPHVAGEAYNAFVATWRQEIDEAGPTGGFHAHGYDAVNLLFGATEAAAIVRDDGALVIGRGALREALAATENYPGLTGSLTCRDESPHAGDCATGEALAIFQLTAAEIDEGNWPPPVVWTLALADDG